MLTLIQKIIWPFTSCRITLSPSQKCWFLPQTSANIFLQLVPKHPEHPIWSSVSMEDCSWELLVCTPPTPLHLIRSCYRDEDGANIEIAEEVRCLYALWLRFTLTYWNKVGESNVCELVFCFFLYHIKSYIVYTVFFGHLTPAVEELRYQHLYHPVPIEEKCPALANVLDQVSAGLFGDSGIYEPWVSFVCSRYMLCSNSPLMSRLLNTIRQGDYYLLSDDFDSCELKVVVNVDCSYWYPSLRYRGTGYGGWGLSG